MSIAFLLLVGNYCSMNWEYYVLKEEPAKVSEMRCVHAKFKCYEARGERFCKAVMNSR